MIEIEAVLANLPSNAQKSIVSTIFMPTLFKTLGFNETTIFPKYNTECGYVDFALRPHQDNEIFLQTGTNPSVLVEISGRNINLREGTAQYKTVVSQLKTYLLSPKCKSAAWGIITNSCHLQLFRKHGKVIHPATQCLEISNNNIVDIVNIIRQKIHSPSTALTVAIYNNKGGVGKTTTTVNLAAVLTAWGKRVLVVDFDPNQKDLTSCLGVSLGQNTFYELLEDKKNLIPLEKVIKPYTIRFKRKKTLTFDVIPCDEKLETQKEHEYLQIFKINRLKQILDKLKPNYDYILIDSPPNWRFFSISATTAADVVLIPTKHNDIFSLKNAANTIKQYIPEVQEFKKDGTPIALPIFWNGEKATAAAKEQARKAIDIIIEQAKKDNPPFDLLPYFYSRYTRDSQNRYIFELPSYANIANATFSQIPAVYRDKIACDYYLALVKEYFLQ